MSKINIIRLNNKIFSVMLLALIFILIFSSFSARSLDNGSDEIGSNDVYDIELNDYLYFDEKDFQTISDNELIIDYPESNTSVIIPEKNRITSITDEKVKIYDKGVDIGSKEGIYELLVSYRAGDIWIPTVETTEALKLEAEYFIDCITNNKTPINDGHAGLRVVKILESSDLSIKNNGKMIKL